MEKEYILMVKISAFRPYPINVSFTRKVSGLSLQIRLCFQVGFILCVTCIGLGKPFALPPHTEKEMRCPLHCTQPVRVDPIK